MASFDENGKYIKTNWKAGDKITATKLNKIEESIEAVNDNDIFRHVEADARLDALEAKDVAHDKELTNVKNLIADNKAAAELGDYEINSRMQFLEQELNEGIAEVNNVASTVDGKIAAAETNMRLQINQGKADMEAMVAEVEGELDDINSQLEQVAKVFNVKEFGGAVGNGEVDDYEAIQFCIDEAIKVNGTVFIPAGNYYISTTLRTKHQTSYHHRPGINIEGEGYASVIQGYKQSTGVTKEPCDYSNDINSQALLALHGGNNSIQKICFKGSRVGLYLGQDNREDTERSSVSFNVIENCWFYDNGTSIIFENGEGCNYNKLRNIHLAQCQIGLHLKQGLYITANNNNRNVFENMRATRAWIGFLVENGDGNFFKDCYGEGISDGSAVIGDKPSQLPAECEDKHTAFIINGSNNTIDGAFCENCDLDLYSIGYKNNFINVGFLDYSGTECKVVFPIDDRQPNYYMGQAIMLPGIRYQANVNALYEGESGLSLVSPIYDIDTKKGRTVRITSDYLNTNDIHSGSRISFKKLNGSLFINVALRFNIEDTSQILYLKVPYSEDLELDEVYTTNIGGTLLLPCVKTTSPHLQTQTQSYYSLSNYDANGENKAIYLVFKPNTTWGASNNVIFVSSVINTAF